MSLVEQMLDTRLMLGYIDAVMKKWYVSVFLDWRLPKSSILTR